MKIDNAVKQLFTTLNRINAVVMMFYSNLMKRAKSAHDSFLWVIYYDSSSIHRLRLFTVESWSKVSNENIAGKPSNGSLVLSFESYCNLSQFGLEQINSVALIFLYLSSSLWFMIHEKSSWNWSQIGLQVFILKIQTSFLRWISLVFTKR